MYCPSPKMNTKLAEVGIYYNGVVNSLANLDSSGRLTGGHLEAQQRRFQRLWRISFAIDRRAYEQLDNKGSLDLLPGSHQGRRPAPAGVRSETGRGCRPVDRSRSDRTQRLAVARSAASGAGSESRTARRRLSGRRTIDQIVHRREGEREEHETLIAHLDRVAAKMAADRELPLELPTLCRELGIGLRVEQASGRRRGALMRARRGWEVVLMRNHSRPAPISAHERFTIAHELGHYVLMRDTTFRARRDADYWLGEELCNRFASRLLIPRHVLTGFGEPGSSRELAASVSEVAQQTGVTFEPAARALVERISAPIADRHVSPRPFLADATPRLPWLVGREPRVVGGAWRQKTGNLRRPRPRTGAGPDAGDERRRDRLTRARQAHVARACAEAAVLPPLSRRCWHRPNIGCVSGARRALIARHYWDCGLGAGSPSVWPCRPSGARLVRAASPWLSFGGFVV